MRKKPNVIIIHAGINGLTKDANIVEYTRSVTTVIDEMNGGSYIQVGFSAEIIKRTDHNFSEKVKDFNKVRKRYCNSKGFHFIDYSSADENRLNQSLLDLSRYGNRLFSKNIHCVKTAGIRSYSSLYFLFCIVCIFVSFGPNTDRYGVSLHIQSECGKIRTRITPNTDPFHAVIINALKAF